MPGEEGDLSGVIRAATFLEASIEVRPLATAVLAGPPLEHGIRCALDGLNLRLEFTAMSGILISRIESDCPKLLILDLDICPRPDQLARFARSLRGDVRIAAVEAYWADRNAPTFADVVVHKPIRRDEWFPALAGIELEISGSCS